MLFVIEVSRPIQWKPIRRCGCVLWLCFLVEWHRNLTRDQHRAVHVAAGIALERGTSDWVPNEKEWAITRKYIPLMEKKAPAAGPEGTQDADE